MENKQAIKLVHILIWVLIGLSVISITRVVTHSYIIDRVEQQEQLGRYFAYHYPYEFYDYGKKKLEHEYIYAILSVVFIIHWIVLLNLSLTRIDSFKTDLLLYKPKWLVQSNLKFRRVLSIYFGLIIVSVIITASIMPLNFIFDFPAVRFSEDEIKSTMVIPLFSIIIFWGSWSLLSVINWVRGKN